MNWHGQACGLLLVSLVGLAVKRGLGVLVAMLLVFGGGPAMADEGGQSEPPRMAMGLIVKLKEARPTSVVRLKASAVPSDGAPRQRQRMFDAARRKSVSFLVQRPTAFAASVIHSGRAIPWEEANAQAQRLRADPDVEWVVVNEIVKRHALGTNNLPTDPGYLRGNASTSAADLINAIPPSGSGQVWLQPLPNSGFRMGVADFPAAWSFIDTWSQSHALAPVVVAVLDTGILPHPDLTGRLLPGYDFVYRPLASGDGDGLDSDPTDLGDWVTTADKAQHPDVFNADCDPEDRSSWHGLAIAGMLVANTNNNQYGAGMLAQLQGPVDSAMLMPVRVAGKCGAEVSSIIEGLLWASGVNYQGAPALPAHPAKIINLSFGSEGNCVSSSDVGSIYLQTINTLRNKGVLVVASSGNGGGTKPSVPASCPGVLAVTGLNQDGYKARYANMISDGVAVASGDVDGATPHPNLADDGIYTTVNAGLTLPTSGYVMGQKAGTSFAAPQAVGVAAMMLAVNPSLSVQQLIDLIKTTSRRPFPASGFGLCNAAVPQGNCTCRNTAPLTCGVGVLDAPEAVAWAASTPGTRGPDTNPSASYFIPSRLTASRMSTGGGGGGGGGSLGWAELFGLASLTALAVMVRRRRRPLHQSRQAAKLLP